MVEGVKTFHIRKDSANNWTLQETSGRVYARDPYKDMIVDLARQIARTHAPSIVYLHSGNGKPPRFWRYSSPRDNGSESDAAVE